jgi:hypothetical protein
MDDLIAPDAVVFGPHPARARPDLTLSGFSLDGANWHAASDAGTRIIRAYEQAATVMPQFSAAIALTVRAMDAMTPVMQAFARDLGKLATVLQPVTDARRERISAMHREYHRRQRRR